MGRWHATCWKSRTRRHDGPGHRHPQATRGRRAARNPAPAAGSRLLWADTTYRESFPLIKDGKMWFGASIHSGDREFGVPQDYPLTATSCRVDEKGQKYIRVKGVRWFTNLDYKERHESLPLYKMYSPNEFPRYDNFDAINVDKTADIPMDYGGIMGVPITFLDKYCPEQFEIIWQADCNARKSDKF